MSFLADNFDLLRDAFLTTLALPSLSGVLRPRASGTLLTAMRVSPVKPLRAAATFYVEVFRNTPLTVVFFFLVFGIVEIDLQFPSRFIAAVAALSPLHRGVRLRGAALRHQLGAAGPGGGGPRARPGLPARR